jgi:uncharacterized protein (TIGR02145 family)
MKKLLKLIAAVFISIQLFAQAPQKMSYQAVIRNASNNLVTNAPVKMKISILQGSATGNAVYSELHSATTNANGLVSIEIGAGTSPTGTFSSINWRSGTYFLKTETDPNNGTNYSIVGTSQLLSVPYALYAEKVNIKKSGDTISIGDIQLFFPGVKTFVGGIPAIIIHGQVWMSKNLEVNTYRNGDPIPEVKDKDTWTSIKTGAWCHFANDTSIGKLYGKLYNWHAVQDPRGLCPIGWRMPSKNDYTILINNLGGDSASAIKLMESKNYWQPSRGTNTSEFSARGGSWRGDDGNFYYWVGFETGNWWTSTKENGNTDWDINYPWYFNINGYRSIVARTPYFKMNAGASIRCIKE